MRKEALVSGLIFQDKRLSTREILQALLDGEKIKLKKADSGINYWLKNSQLESDSISYLQGIPQTWFNPDIHYEIDYE